MMVAVAVESTAVVGKLIEVPAVISVTLPSGSGT
jgi:hypothetical protein